MSPPLLTTTSKIQDMDQDTGNPQYGIRFQPEHSSFTAGQDLHLINTVTINNHPESSTLTRLKAALNPVPSASYDSYEATERSECFPNTRVQLLNDIEAWIHSETFQTSIYVLDGVAGIGKSTVAQTIAARAAALGLLGASFFFSRDEALRKVARNFFPTLAYQLSCYNGQFAASINQSLEKNPDAPAKQLHQQLLLLLLYPLQKLLSEKSKPTLLVVDALDECEEAKAEELLKLLGQYAQRMKGLKILITTRPEAHLRDVLDEDGNHERFRLHEIEDSIVQSDIRLYLRCQLSVEEIRKASGNRRSLWNPTDKDMEMLCGICGTLFIIAATAIKFILDQKRRNPEKQLTRLLDGVSGSGFVGSKYTNVLDETYLRIVFAARPDPDGGDEDWFMDLNKILGALIALSSPLPCNALASLLDMLPDDVEGILCQLHSLVAPIGSDENMTFRIHHKSFPDFITNRDRIRHVLCNWESRIDPEMDYLLWIDVVNQHLQLAKACLQVMNHQLKWNMAGIRKEDWYKDKSDIPLLTPQLISRDLAYAALHWAAHLRNAHGLETDIELRECLHIWASRHLLAWMEVMVILDEVNTMYHTLQDAIESVNYVTDKAWDEQARIQELLSDANRFVHHGSEVMKLSPMHIYRSCLPFTPTETSLYKSYNPMTMLKIGLGKSSQWNPLLATLIGHSDAVNSVAFSSDGLWLASGSSDSTIQIWEASTGEHTFTLTGHSHWVRSIAFSTNGSQLASGSSDKTIRLWDAKTGEHISTLTGHSYPISSVAFSSDGWRLASGSDDGTIRLWDTRTGAHICTLDEHEDSVNSVVFSTDASRLASGSDDNTVRLWDTISGTQILTLTDHSESVSSVAFSTDSSQLVSGSYDNTLKLWDAKTGAHIRTFTGHSDSISSVAFSSDGSRIASGSSDETVHVWDTETGVVIYTLAGHCHAITSVAFSNDGLLLASGSDDDTIRVWDMSTGGNITNLIGHSNWVSSVAFSKDGLQLASGSEDNTVQLWDAKTGAHICTLAGHENSVNSVAFQNDGSHVASGSGDGTVRVWDSKTGAHVSTLTTDVTLHDSVTAPTHSSLASDNDEESDIDSSPIHDDSDSEDSATVSTDGTSLDSQSEEEESDLINSVAFSSDGSRLASGSDNNTIHLWDAKTGSHILTLHGHTGSVISVAFSRAGFRLASGSTDDTVRLWDAETGTHIRTLDGHSGLVNSVKFSNDDSRLASASGDETAQLWDANTGARIYSLTGHSDSVNSIDFSSDGLLLATGSDDKTVRLWDANTGAQMFTLTGHTDLVNSVAFSNDVCRLVSGSDDHTVRLWNPKTGVHISTLTSHSSWVNSVAFSSDDLRIASGSNDGTICLWDSTSGECICTLTDHAGQVNSVAFSQDSSRLASGSDDETIQIWDAKTGGHISTFTIDSQWVTSVAFSSDGLRIASGSQDRTIRLWDVKRGTLLSTLTGHLDWVTSVAFSSDTSRLASGSYDKTIRIWNADTGDHIYTLTGHSSWVESVSFSSDGTRLVSASSDETLRLWNIETGAHISTLTAPSNLIMMEVVFLRNDSAIIHHATPKPQLPRDQTADSVHLLLLVKGESPPITGLHIANLPLEAEGSLEWRFTPVCWFPPDIQGWRLAYDHWHSQVAVGTKSGRVMSLDFTFEFLPPILDLP